MLLCVFLNTGGLQQPFEIVHIIQEINTIPYALLIQTIVIGLPHDAITHYDRDGCKKKNLLVHFAY